MVFLFRVNAYFTLILTKKLQLLLPSLRPGPY